MGRVTWGLLGAGLLVGCTGGEETLPTLDASEPERPAMVDEEPPAGTGGEAPAPEDDGEPESTVPYPDPAWAEGAPEDHGLDGAQLEQAWGEAVAQDSHCLLVIRNGVLVFERYAEGHDATTPQTSWSIAKSHAATLVGIAIERGDLGSLADPVADYVPAWQGTPREAITLRDVLAMQSGLSWSAFDDYLVLAVLSQDNTEHALGLSLADEPGTGWTYHNGAVQILEPVFRAATGMTIEQYAQEHLWGRIGIDATWNHDPAGNPTAYASVMASCRDQARMGYLYLHEGQWAGATPGSVESVVPSSWVAQVKTPSQATNLAYGYLWWLNGEPAISPMGDDLGGRLSPATPVDTFSMRGFGNQFVDVIPSLDMVVVRFGADPMSSFDIGKLIDDAKFDIHEAIMDPVMAAVVE